MIERCSDCGWWASDRGQALILMRNFFGELLCECESVEFKRIALTTPDSVMVVSHVMATCISCRVVLHAETDPHVENLEPEAETALQASA